MLKSTLESIITKYHLNGLTEAAKYVIKDKTIDIAFSPAENKSLYGRIKCSDFDLKDVTLGIYATSQLLKLIKIFDTEVELDVHIEQDTAMILALKDSKYNLEFYLADLNLIGRTPKIKEPKEYELEFIIDSEFISKFSSAKKALGDIKCFTIEANQLKENTATIVVGDDELYSNKLRFDITTTSKDMISPIPFEASIFNEVLIANKNCNLGTFALSKEGLIKLGFLEGNIESNYFIVRLEKR